MPKLVFFSNKSSVIVQFNRVFKVFTFKIILVFLIKYGHKKKLYK